MLTSCCLWSSLQVSKSIISAKETDEETITLMMMDESQSYKDPFVALELKGVFGVLKLEGMMPTEIGEEIIEEEQVFGVRDYEDAFADMECEEGVPGTLPEAKHGA